ETALGKRIGVVAVRVVRASDESLPVVPMAYREFTGAALLARSDEIPLPDRGAIGRDAVGRRPTAIRVFDHRSAALRTVFLGALARPDAGRNALHVRLEVGRHLRLRDPFGMVFEGLDHRPPARRGPRVLPFYELAIVEFLEDVVPRGLGPQAESFHLLDEGSFAVSRGRLRSILADRDIPDAVERLSGDQHRQVRFADGPIRIVFPPPGILDAVSLGVERLAAEIDLRFRGLRERVRGDRREE